MVRKDAARAIATSSVKEERERETLLIKLKTVSQRAHSSADFFVSICSVLAFADERVYYRLMVQFQQLFAILERDCLMSASKRNSSVKEICEKYLVFLARSDAVQEDLDFFKKRINGSVNDLLHSTKKYIAEMKKEVEKEPIVSVVYAYTLYAAIAFGGSILRRMQRAAMGLNARSNDGSAIYAFEQVDDIARFRRAMQRDIDALLLLPRADTDDGGDDKSSQSIATKDRADTMDAVHLTEQQLEDCIRVKQSIFVQNNRVIADVVLRSPLSSYMSLVHVVFAATARGDWKTAFIAASILTVVVTVICLLIAVPLLCTAVTMRSLGFAKS